MIAEYKKVQELYVGQGSRTLYARIREHIRDYRQAAKDRVVPDPTYPYQKSFWMWEHMFLKHGAPREIDTMKDFKLKKVSNHRDPLNR